MKNGLTVGTIVLAVAIVISFLLSCVALWPGMYANNKKLTTYENDRIKALLVSAVKDHCSSLYKIDKQTIYDEKHMNSIVQYDEHAMSQKSWFCIINPGFMNTATKVDDGKYQVTIKMFYPESYYYCFEISRIDEEYAITSFGIDI